MSRRQESAARRPEAAAPQMQASDLDEACFLAELRRSVEGAYTAAEEKLARTHPRWADRLDRVCARLAH